MIRMYRYTAGDESLVAIDGRDVMIPRFRNRRTVHALCLINRLDGIVIIDKSEKADFRLEYMPKDGSAACPTENARRCSVAFADLLGVKPFHTKEYSLEDQGGVHSACILSHLGESKEVAIDGTPSGSVFCEGEFE